MSVSLLDTAGGGDPGRPEMVHPSEEEIVLRHERLPERGARRQRPLWQGDLGPAWNTL